MTDSSPIAPVSITDRASISIVESDSSLYSIGSYIRSKHFDHEDGRRTYYPEFHSHGARIQRGGFLVTDQERSLMKYKMRGYPPPPCSAYDSVSVDLRKMHRRRRIETDVPGASNGSITHSKAHLHQQNHSNLSNAVDGSISSKNQEHSTTILASASESRPSGCSLAQDIDFQRISRCGLWGEDTDVFGVENIYGPDEIREDFIKNIDDGATFEFCKVCGESHIPPGPPLTLQDRDTCSSYLPEWFPRKRGERSWEIFIDMINEMRRMQRILDVSFSNQQAQWDMKYHDGTQYSVYILGRRPRSGWWKCGIIGEIECRLCGEVESPQSQTSAGIKSSKSSSEYASARLELLQSFVDSNISQAAIEDKAICLERIREVTEAEFSVLSRI